MTQSLEPLRGSEGEPFELTGPEHDGVLGIRHATRGVAAKLKFEGGQWQWDAGRSVSWNKEGESIVDIRGAIQRATQIFPDGPQ